MTNIHMINELNNNSIFPAAGKKKQLPDSVIDTKTDIGRIPGLYKNDDGYRPYTIYVRSGEFSLQLFFRIKFRFEFLLLGFGSFFPAYFEDPRIGMTRNFISHFSTQIYANLLCN